MWLKRGFDIVLSSLGLLVFWPLMLPIAALIKLDSAGSIFYRQLRVGQFGKEFFILKFRTMQEQAQSDWSQLTVGDDQRVTRVGHFLRRTKLDELPQLLNVLKGEMSFVGPRAEVAKYVNRFKEDYQKILELRPGITDLASIKYRNEAELLGRAEDPERYYLEQVLPDKIKLALVYRERVSLVLDIRIIALTVLELLGDHFFKSRSVDEIRG